MSNATLEWIGKKTEQLPSIPKDVERWVTPAISVAALALGAGYVYSSYGTRRSKNGPQEPPVVSAYIPWFGSFWAMNRDPDGFMDSAAARYPGGVFGVKAMGHTHYFVTDPKLIKQVYEKPKLYNMSPIQIGWAENIFSISREALYGSMIFPTILAPHMTRSVSPSCMMSLVDSFDASLLEAVHTLTLPSPSESVSLQSFLHGIAYKATGEALFGPTFDPSTAEIFKGFDESVWRVAAGYPSRLLSKFVDSREKMIQWFSEYAEKPFESSELVSLMVQFTKEGGFSKRDIGAVMLCTWWPVIGNAPWACFWTIALQAQRPEGFGPLLAELDAAGSLWSASNPEAKGPYTKHLAEFFASSPSTPLLNSIISETLRYTSDSWSMRHVEEDGTILGKYALKRGDTLICNTRATHMDASVYGNPTEFVPNRYATADGTKAKEFQGWFGGGISICGGRHFARYHMRILITTIITSFNLEVDASKAGIKGLSVINRGFGLRRPNGDLFVKISRR